MAWEVKFKRKDNQKYWSAGKLSIGKYGPGIGMKKTRELMDYINSVGDGEYLNFYLWEPFDKQKLDKQQSETDCAQELNDEIPF